MKSVKSSDIKITKKGFVSCPECKFKTLVKDMELATKKVCCQSCSQIFEIKGVG